MEYYCLHDSAINVPESYMSAWGKEHVKPFIAHNFACKIVVLNSKDTIFNKVVKRGNFDKVLRDDLKKYATLAGVKFGGYNKSKQYLIFNYSISIPMTDVGVPASLTIDKQGNYKVWDEYAKLK
jgi:hypothetical protein